MRVGDMVKFKRTGEVGLIIEKIRKCVPDGNPNGDFNIEYHWRISCNDKIISVPSKWFSGQFRHVEVVR